MVLTTRRTFALLLSLLLVALWLPAALVQHASAAVTQIPSNYFTVQDSTANDYPNQGDLTQMGRDDSDPNTLKVFWSWDDTDFTGQVGDACALFDTDGDTKINLAVCGQVENGPTAGTVVQSSISPTVWTCGDAKDDRCTTPTAVPFTAADVTAGALPNLTAGDLVTPTDPFPTGSYSPNDSTLGVNMSKAFLDSVLHASAFLTNVCSYPSIGNGGNADPKDCVVNPGGGFLSIVKHTIGGDGTFNFTVASPSNSPTSFTRSVTTSGNTGTSLPASVIVGTDTSVTETVPSNWMLNGATCTKQGGGATGTFNSATNKISGIAIESGQVTTCTFTDEKAAPALTLKKTASPTTYSKVGDTISYSYELKNTGNVPLTQPYAVSDDKVSVTCPSTPSPLAIGATVTCTASHTITQADLDAGSITNKATATANYGGSTVTSNQATATVTAVQTPVLSLKKTASPLTYNAVGDTISYSYVLTNAGNVTLSAPYAVSDDKVSVTCPSTPSSLAPGDKVTCTASHTITQADLDAGIITNKATGTAMHGTDTVTSNQDQATVRAQQTVQLSLTKKASPLTYNSVGDAVGYTYVLTNTGNVTLSAPYAVSDDKTTVSCPSTPSSLAPGDKVTCTASYTIKQADLDAGSVTNTATATAMHGTDTVTSNVAQATVTAIQSPKVSLKKSASPTTYDAVGDVIVYSYDLKNTGNVTLSSPYSVTDDKTTVTCPNTPASLAVGSTVTCSATYTITQADLDSGSVTNTATGSATYKGNPVTSGPAQATVTAVQKPTLKLTKSASPTTYNTVGQVIGYTYDLKNTGNVTLSPPYAVTDDKTSVSCPSTPASLAVGATVTCTSSYVITQANLDAGSVTNKATATAKFGPDTVTSNQAQATVTAVQAPALTLTKTPSPTTYNAVGDTIGYTYALKNTGNVTLSPPYAVTDDKTSVTCPSSPASLAVGATVTCTSTYTIKQADLDAGSVTNTATATAKFGPDTVTSNQAQATVTAVQSPVLSLKKSASPLTYKAVGDVITYSYDLKNTGNVTLSSPYTVTDDKTTVTCPNTPASLAVGATVTCSATYSIKQSDIDSGSVTNTATGTAKFGAATVTSNPAQATVQAQQNALLSLTKSASPMTYKAVGDTITYTYDVINSGNVTLSAPYAVTDDKTSVTCPTTPSTLAPGADVKCSATYTVTQADLDAGSVTNKATATAKFGATTVTSNQAQVTVQAVQAPALALTKKALTATYAKVGDVLQYAYTVKNVGNVTLLAPYTVDDDVVNAAGGTVSCALAPSSIAPGDSVPCTASYTVTQADLDAGSVHNTAIGHAFFGTTKVTSAPADATVPANQQPALSLVKKATETSYDAPGQVLHYTYTVTNAGNVTLASPYAIADNRLSNADCSTGPAKLAPGASFTCTGSYSVTQADLDAGSVLNVATATATFGGKPVTSPQAQATVPATPKPALLLVKNAAQPSFSAVGDTLDYTYTLTNNGNVTLAAPYSVTDDKVASVTCPTLPATLAPAASVQCTSSYTVTQADIDAGNVTNHATATAVFGTTGVTSNPAQATVPANQSPALKLVKSVDKDSAEYGDTLTYTLAVTNVGNQSLSAVTVTDVVPDGTEYVTDSAGPATMTPTFDSGTKTLSWSVGALAPGATVDTLTFQVTVTKPAFDTAVGLPAEVIDNVAAVGADHVDSTPSNHVKTPVVAVLGEKVVRKPTKKPQLPFTGMPVLQAVALASLMIGSGLILGRTRRRRQH